MATGNGGAKVRLVILLLALVVVAGFGWYKLKGGGFSGGGGGGIEMTVFNGDLLGKSLEEASAALGAQPAEQPNPDGEKSTAKIYLYTLTGAAPGRDLVRIRVAANGKIIATNFVDQAGIVIDAPSTR